MENIEELVQRCNAGNVVEVGFEMPSRTVRTMVAYFRAYGASPRPGTCRLAYPAAGEERNGLLVDTEIDTFCGGVQGGPVSLYIPIKAIRNFSILR